MKYIDGGVCAPQGFAAAGVHCGFRKNKTKKDLALIVSQTDCSAAAVYTTNKVKGAPIAVTRSNLADGHARAILCNSGNANTCAPGGKELARNVCAAAAQHLGIKDTDIVVASTGVIGKALSLDPFLLGIPQAVNALSADGGSAAAEAILTTDKAVKEVAVSFELGGKKCVIGAIAKGSGMVHPNMATVLSFLTTDAAISPAMLQEAFRADIEDSYNQISIDGETSTNDMAVILANGLAGNALISEKGPDFDIFCQALHLVTDFLAREIAKDGEGASKTLLCQVSHAATKELARKISRSIVSSSLVKTAIFGEDANWGRILCAIGYTPGDFSVENVDIQLTSARGRITVCKGSHHQDFDEVEAAAILSEDEIQILVDLHDGDFDACAFGCDMTYDYITINGAYRK